MKYDLTGQKFHNLTVIKKADEQNGQKTMWICRCDCGNETKASTSDLRNGHKKSCGCRKKRPNAKDLTGQRFGRLTVIKRNGTNQHRRAIWRCKCDCGKYTNVNAPDLLSGNTKSCGCWFRNKHKYNV